MFGVNPWKLVPWMGHKRIDETMRYDPDRKIIAMLDARRLCWVEESRGKTVAKPKALTAENPEVLCR